MEGAPGAAVRYADVVVSHPVTSTARHLRANAYRDGSQAAGKERTKRLRYSLDVLPLAVETYGRWGGAAVSFLRELARQVATEDAALAHLGRWAAAALMSRWFTSLAVCLQAANARSAADAFGVPRCRWAPTGMDAPASWELLTGTLQGGAGDPATE